MKLLEYLRRERGLSQSRLGASCVPPVPVSDICKAERRGFVMFPSQAERIAEALGWTGEPSALFEDIEVKEAN